ncbi:MAG: polymerase subunit delta [Kosmotogales bacterium]|nr:polymerase subunit delta [Kosmotogales bacterium]
MIYIMNGNSSVLNSIYLDGLSSKSQVDKTKIDKDTKNKDEALESYISVNNMFGTNNIFIARDFSEYKESEKKSLLKLIKENNHLKYYIEGNIKIKNAEYIRFERPKPWENNKWIEYILKIASSIGLKTNKKVADLFYESFLTNDYLIYNELKKLKILDKEIDTDDFLKYVNHPKNDEISELTMKLVAQNEDIDIKEFSDIEISYLINYISKFFFDLLKIHENKKNLNFSSWQDVKFISDRINLKPKRVADIVGYSFSSKEKKINYIQKYDYKKVKEILNLLQECDYLYKNGEINDSVAKSRIVSSFSKSKN